MTANQSFYWPNGPTWRVVLVVPDASRLFVLRASRLHFFTFLCFVSVVRLRNSPSHDGDDDFRQYHRDEDGEIRAFEVSPEDGGLRRADPAELKGGDATHNAAALRGVLDGNQNAYRDIAVLNAAAALVVAGKVQKLREGVRFATEALNSGAAKRTFESLVEESNI